MLLLHLHVVITRVKLRIGLQIMKWDTFYKYSIPAPVLPYGFLGWANFINLYLSHDGLAPNPSIVDLEMAE